MIHKDLTNPAGNPPQVDFKQQRGREARTHPEKESKKWTKGLSSTLLMCFWCFQIGTMGKQFVHNEVWFWRTLHRWDSNSVYLWFYILCAGVLFAWGDTHTHAKQNASHFNTENQIRSNVSYCLSTSASHARYMPHKDEDCSCSTGQASCTALQLGYYCWTIVICNNIICTVKYEATLKIWIIQLAI